MFRAPSEVSTLSLASNSYSITPRTSKARTPAPTPSHENFAGTLTRVCDEGAISTSSSNNNGAAVPSWTRSRAPRTLILAGKSGMFRVRLIDAR